ncbi:hypothetical protein B0H12DRAFT_1240366 [Mycena haematopus]|nr:hypothetical protein B0H12DRAFT_1241522 [Mycena haematopus]KAJ7228029.1 hypothetical protein B0H12DRAFT_1240366 [Mycena haematopus]
MKMERRGARRECVLLVHAAALKGFLARTTTATTQRSVAVTPPPSRLRSCFRLPLLRPRKISSAEVARTEESTRCREETLQATDNTGTIVAINCRGFNEALLKDLALHTRPWLGWRAHDARAPGYVDERDGCADTPQLPSSRTSPSFALPFFAAASPGGAIRAMRMRMQEAFRIQTEGWGSEQEHAEGGTRHPDVRVHWDQPPPRGHGRVM